MSGQPETPELDKMQQATEEFHTEAIGEFLEWLSVNGYWIAQFKRYDEYRDPKLTATSKTFEQLLAEYCEIDLVKVEREKRAILKWAREKGI